MPVARLTIRASAGARELPFGLRRVRELAPPAEQRRRLRVVPLPEWRRYLDQAPVDCISGSGANSR